MRAIRTLFDKLVAFNVENESHYQRNRAYFAAVAAIVAVFWGHALTNRALDQQVWEVRQYIQYKKPNIDQGELTRLATAIVKQAQRLELNSDMKIKGKTIDRVALLAGMVYTESSFSQKAVSRSGALGYMQLMTPTAKWLARTHKIDLNHETIWNADINIYLGVTYLNMLLKEFNNVRSAMLAYNVGPGDFRRGRGVPAYWRSIRRFYVDMKASDPATVGRAIVALRD